jgi:hypothetical protein
LFHSHSDIGTACDLFPDVIRGVHLNDLVRVKIGHWVQQATSAWDDLPPGLSNEDRAHLQGQTASEKPILDQVSRSLIHNVPPGYENDAEVRRLSEQELYLPACILSSTRTLSRAHFYLEFARVLGIPLVIDPVRSRYFEVLFQRIKENLRQGSPEKIIAKFEGSVLKPEIDEGLVSVDLSIPAVTELVLRFD